MSKLMLVAICGVAVLGAGAKGQTFAEYFIDGMNLTDPGRGTNNAEPGDVIRLSLRVNHDGLSYAGGKVDILLGGVQPGDITLTEDSFAFPFDPWEIGRTPITRIVASDGPADATQPHNIDVVAFAEGDDSRISDLSGDYFDFASVPPGLGGLGGAFPVASGDAIFVFDYVYDGGVDCIGAEPSDTARLWRNGQDLNGIVVDAVAGDFFGCIPSPAGIAVVLGGAVVGVRRRR